MKRGIIAPPAIEAPAPRQPSFGSAAAKAQALKPGCQNPNRSALWAFAGAGLRILEVPQRRFRSVEEEQAAFRASMAKAQERVRPADAGAGPGKPAARPAKAKAR